MTKKNKRKILLPGTLFTVVLWVVHDFKPHQGLPLFGVVAYCILLSNISDIYRSFASAVAALLIIESAETIPLLGAQVIAQFDEGLCGQEWRLRVRNLMTG